MVVEPLVELTGVELARRLRAREVSAREVVAAHLARIDAVDGAVNAVVTRTPEQALARAGELDDHLARTGSPIGPLHGLPIVHKDLLETAGVRTTFGSPAFADHVPAADHPMVERLRRAGAVMLGKSNTPEFGAGSHTFNPVFGLTRNPWDLGRSCGGSSGGAAVAVACGMAPLADGSDLGGSLRNPTGFCGVVGLRPSVGRVPETGPLATRLRMPVEGPIARNVADTALLLAAMAGPHPLAPTALAEPGSAFLPPLEPFDGAARVAFSVDLGDLPVDARVRAVVEGLVPTLEHLGWSVRDAVPDLDGADRAFEVTRSWYTAARQRRLDPAQRAMVKDVIKQERAKGESLGALELADAFAIETRLVQAAVRFFDEHDLFVCPATQVPAFPAHEEWVGEIDGRAMASYIEWMRVCSRITVLGLPSLSLPVGFTPEGLPIGVQIVGGDGADRLVLRAGAMIEAALALHLRPPIEALAAG
jgi:amidase